jgi:hypothetical protein
MLTRVTIIMVSNTPIIAIMATIANISITATIIGAIAIVIAIILVVIDNVIERAINGV